MVCQSLCRLKAIKHLLLILNFVFQSVLNDFMALGRPAWDEARQVLQRVLSSHEVLFPTVILHALNQ